MSKRAMTRSERRQVERAMARRQARATPACEPDQLGPD
jgi:hypothetical protein